MPGVGREHPSDHRRTPTVPMRSSIDLHFPQLADLVEEWWRGVHPEGVPPHITLLYPWQHPVTDTDLGAVSAIAAAHDPFAVEFTAVASFASGVVYLHPEPQSTLRRLTSRLVNAFPDTPPYGGRFADPVPHLTLGKAQPGAELDGLQTQIAESLRGHLPVVEDVYALSVMEEQPDRSWRTVTSVTLRDTESTA